MKTCTRCKVEKPQDDFYKDKRRKDGLYSYCKSCKNDIKKAYRRSLEGYLREKYHQIKRRVGKAEGYEKIYLKIDKEEFVKWSLSDTKYIELHEFWSSCFCKYDSYYCPSIDRIDSKGHYELGNIQWISWKDHLKKTAKEKTDGRSGD